MHIPFLNHCDRHMQTKYIVHSRRKKLHICKVLIDVHFLQLHFFAKVEKFSKATNLDSSHGQEPSDRLHFPSSIEVMQHNFLRHFHKIKRQFSPKRFSAVCVCSALCCWLFYGDGNTEDGASCKWVWSTTITFRRLFPQNGNCPHIIATDTMPC